MHSHSAYPMKLDEANLKINSNFKKINLNVKLDTVVMKTGAYFSFALLHLC